jgi:multicomponent Na+:H+ antiporter subunit G
MSTLELLAAVLLGLGTFFCVVGGIGLHRMPDFYTRTHAASITDTLGAALVLLGLMFLCTGQHWTVAVKLGMVLVLIWITSPTSSHALVKAAAAEGVRWMTAPSKEAASESQDPQEGP